MNKLFNITLIMVMLSMVIVSAQQEEIRFYHPLDTNLTISEKCRVDGFLCDTSYTCNLSVLDPFQDTIIDAQLMNRGAVYYNFTLNTSQTDQNGINEATVDCSNTTFAGSNTFFYEITPNGSPPVSQGQGLILLGSVALLLIISLFFGWLGHKATNPTIMLSFLAFSMLIAVFTLGLIVNVVELSFGTFSEIVGNFSSVYTLFTVLLSVGALALILYLVWVALNYYWTLRGMKDTFTIS